MVILVTILGIVCVAGTTILEAIHAQARSREDPAVTALRIRVEKIAALPIFVELASLRGEKSTPDFWVEFVREADVAGIPPEDWATFQLSFFRKASPYVGPVDAGGDLINPTAKISTEKNRFFATCTFPDSPS